MTEVQRFSGPLTLSGILLVLNKLFFGPMGPDEIRASESSYDGLVKIWQTYRSVGESLMICGCRIVFDESVEPGMLRFVDSMNPDSTYCNGWYKIEESLPSKAERDR